MFPYRALWPLIRLLPPELAHRLGLLALRLPLPYAAPPPPDPFEKCGLRFRNRVGVAAGFDKDAVALPGLERLGVGFVEVGTVLVAPWAGNPERPRLKRLLDVEGVWNRLGFPSQGLEAVRRRLAAFPRRRRHGMLVGCNVGPHPGHLKAAADADAYLGLAAAELQQLVAGLHADADFFVVNLSSPNTPGLRRLLADRRLASGLVAPLRAALRRLDAGRERPTPLLVKLPPEDADRAPWTRETLAALVEPLLGEAACDGFVAVNTSTRLTAELLGGDAGGVSGRPLLGVAVQTVRLLRGLAGDGVLIAGCGGVSRPADAVALVEAGADVVELYTGLIYEGPTLPARCATALRAHPPALEPGGGGG
jgi:dihydroorotate dehydrogenase